MTEPHIGQERADSWCQTGNFEVFRIVSIPELSLRALVVAICGAEA